MYNNDALRKLRHNANFSQEYMGELLEMSQAAYNRLENGKRNLKMEDIDKIAKAVKRPQEEVFCELQGCTVHNSINDNAQNNQNIVNVNDKEMLKLLLVEKDKRIELLEKLLQNKG